MKKNEAWTVGGIFLVAVVLRLYRLGYPEMWCDEIDYAWSTSPPFAPMGVVTELLTGGWYMPLPFVLQNVFLWLCAPFFEDVLRSAFLQRAPSVLMGSLAVPATYWLGRQMAGRRVAAAAAWMAALFLFPLFYSREARFYADAMFFSAVTPAVYLYTWRSGGKAWWKGLLLLCAATGACYAMMSCAVWPAGIAVVSAYLAARALWGGRRRARGEEIPPVKVSLACGGASVLALLLASPFFLVYMGWNWLDWLTKPPQAGAGGAVVKATVDRAVRGLARPEITDFPPLSVLFRDAVGRMFFGIGWIEVVLVGVCLVAGLIAFVRRGPRQLMRRCLFAVLVLAVAYTGYRVLRLRYYYARLLLPFAPLAYVFAGLGLQSLVAAAGRRAGGTRRGICIAFWCVVTGALALHTIRCIVPFYGLEAKHIARYGAIAEWLNANLEAGQPYILDEISDVKDVSKYYRTPGREPAWIRKERGPDGRKEHGEEFFAFLEQFPEACWVESWGEWGGAFRPVDRSHLRAPFRRKAEIRNEKLERLVVAGIIPHTLEPLIGMRDYTIRIWYNTEEDIDAAMREQGQSIRCLYPGWRFHYVGRSRSGRVLYARAHDGKTGALIVRNLAEAPVEGQVRLSVRVADETNAVPYRLALHGAARQGVLPATNGFAWIEGPSVTLPPGDHEMIWQVETEREQPTLVIHHGGANPAPQERGFVPNGA